jgi:hypothetical protein
MTSPVRSGRFSLLTVMLPPSTKPPINSTSGDVDLY